MPESKGSRRGSEQVSSATRVEDLRGSDTGDNGLGGLRYLEAERYPYVEAEFGFEVVRRAKGERSLILSGAVL